MTKWIRPGVPTVETEKALWDLPGRYVGRYEVMAHAMASGKWFTAWALCKIVRPVMASWRYQLPERRTVMHSDRGLEMVEIYPIVKDTLRNMVRRGYLERTRGPRERRSWGKGHHKGKVSLYRLVRAPQRVYAVDQPIRNQVAWAGINRMERMRHYPRRFRDMWVG